MISIKEFLKKSPSEQEKILNEMESKLKAYETAEHGLYRYSKGCRCEICKSAKSDSQKKYKLKKLTAVRSA